MIGQTISHYKILEKIGEGGMGVVYKARDTELDRDVALKFLPRDVSMSEEERSRFIHEAKAASALEHPNICAIHHIERTSDGQMFIVMGYYEGQSISKKVEKGRLDVDQAVSIAIQIAEGLQAAHEKGIVHRDIKSSNVIVSDKGQVKILDFGLAKRRGLSKLTKTGTTIGTAAYMSPEQAQGESVDQRTDLWSLGVVLYEMVTGRLPFRGEHEAAILYSVVNEQPKPIEASISDASHELIHIINRALEKDPAERYKTAEDILIDLKRLKKETSRYGYPAVRSGMRSHARRRKRLIMVAGGAITVIGAVILIVMFTKNSTGINPDWTQHPIEIPFKEIGEPGISGDGNSIAFPAKDKDGVIGIYIMNVKQGSPRLITTIPCQGWLPGLEVSADGGLLHYKYVNNAIAGTFDGYVIYTNDGPPRKVFQGGHLSRFAPDGKRVGYFRGGLRGPFPSPSGKRELWSVGIDGSDPRPEFIDSLSESVEGYLSFSYSPDGKRVAWLRSFSEKYEEIIIHDLGTGQEKTITSGRKNIDEVIWIREDKILYTTTDKSGIKNVWIIPVDGGESVQITKGYEAITWIKPSSDGQKLLYVQTRRIADLWLVNLVHKRSQQITFAEENLFAPAFSPNGKEIAFLVADPMAGNPQLDLGYGFTHLYIMDKEGKNRIQLTFGEEVVSSPVWCPDGKRIAFGARRLSELIDSTRTYIIEPSNPTSRKYIAMGRPDQWVDSSRVMVVIKGLVYVVSIPTSSVSRVSEDSLWSEYVKGGKYILSVDYRLRQPEQRNLWLSDATKSPQVRQKTPRKLPWTSLHVYALRDFVLDGPGNFIYQLRSCGEMWRMSLPDGKEERIQADLLGADPFENFAPSWDGKEIIVVKSRLESKIVMIENLFK